jgi:hypothetical protein
MDNTIVKHFLDKPQSAVNVDLLTETVNGWFDAYELNSGQIQIIASAGITAGAIIFEQTNDATVATGVALQVNEVNTSAITTTAINIAASSNRMFQMAILSRYIRVRISTAFVGGTVKAASYFSTQPVSSLMTLVTQQSGTTMTLAALAAGANNIGKVNIDNGQGAEDAVAVGNSLRVGGKVKTVMPLTLVDNDQVDLTLTTGRQLLTKEFSPTELDLPNMTGFISNSAVAQILKNASGASVRNFITRLAIDADALSAATQLVIRDASIAGTGQASNTLTSATHDLKVGDEIVFSSVGTMTGITVGTRYFVLSAASATTFTISASRFGTVVAITGTSAFAFNRIHFSMNLKTAALPITEITFRTPLKGAPNLATEIVVNTAVTGNINYNVSGYTGFSIT